MHQGNPGGTRLAEATCRRSARNLSRRIGNATPIGECAGIRWVFEHRRQRALVGAFHNT